MARERLDKEKTVWCIAYINRDYIPLAKQELRKHPEYNKIIPYIPTVRILKKVFKGKNEFQDVPLLFNYGFFKIPIYLAEDAEFLADMKNKISCVFSWVRDLIPPKPDAVYDGDGEFIYYKKYVSVAMATEEEIRAVAKSQINLSIYDSDDLENIIKGCIVVLHGYPFDGIQAEILNINKKKNQIRVRLIIESIRTKEVIVSFDNVYYTIYSGGYDENSREKSLEEIEERGKVRLDKLMLNLQN